MALGPAGTLMLRGFLLGLGVALLAFWLSRSAQAHSAGYHVHTLYTGLACVYVVSDGTTWQAVAVNRLGFQGSCE